MIVRVLVGKNNDNCNDDENKSTACGCQRSAAAAFRKITSRKKGINMSKHLKVICPTGMGSPFDSKQPI